MVAMKICYNQTKSGWMVKIKSLAKVTLLAILVLQAEVAASQVGEDHR